MENEKLYTMPEVAKMLGVHLNTARYYVNSGQLKRTFVPYTKAYLCTEKQVNDFKKWHFDNDGYMSCEQVAKKLQISVSWVHYLVKAGKLKCIKVNKAIKRLRFNPQEVEEFAKNYRKK